MYRYMHFRIFQTLYSLQRVAEITSSTAETPNEKAFQESYSRCINDALQRLRDPKNPSNPQYSWQLFKQLHSSLQQKAQKRSSLVLDMNDISEKLATLRSTVIAMPGVTAPGQQVSASRSCCLFLSFKLSS